MRVEIQIDKLSPLFWLHLQSIYPKIFWESPKDDLIVAGIGSALAFDSLPTCQGSQTPRFFGGENFCSRSWGNWEGVPSSWYNLPLVELTRENMTYKLCFNLTKDIDLKHLVNQLVFDVKPTFKPFKKPITRQDFPSYSTWEKNINDCLGLIKSKRLKKVVLSRLTSFDFSSALNPYHILTELPKGSREISLFCFEFEKGLSFLGASPEILYRKSKRQITSSAVAGTRPRGKDTSEDEKLEKELLKCFKDRHEFQVVEDYIGKGLSTLCKSVTKHASKNILKTPSVQHITSTFQGELKENTSNSDIIKTLQPTPAVCGYPRINALDIIKEKEPFDRGWYSAPVGWISGEKAHFLVGIRSSLIKDSTLHLFAATGIVNGSIPTDEWAELEHKMSQFKIWNKK